MPGCDLPAPESLVSLTIHLSKPFQATRAPKRKKPAPSISARGGLSSREEVSIGYPLPASGRRSDRYESRSSVPVVRVQLVVNKIRINVSPKQIQLYGRSKTLSRIFFTPACPYYLDPEPTKHPHGKSPIVLNR